MNIDHSIPGYSTVNDWPRKPQTPFSVKDCGRYRDGGPRGGSFYIDIIDANEHIYSFFFDRMLGRLCWGSGLENDEDAAFIQKGSTLEKEAFEVIESAVHNTMSINQEEITRDHILNLLDHARKFTNL
ncbi:hypothetical protein [uncultured Rubinisphaera sp.]|uniref:hypothetical protein n=1 Tax=uncultured Rubinisphaera sp. TaxID=1678686 RepID=UPI0030DD5757|tara:strand:+ start:304 stop:687 length:384 start_codon:yes stop_codon:yes gene_type:complete